MLARENLDGSHECLRRAQSSGTTREHSRRITERDVRDWPESSPLVPYVQAIEVLLSRNVFLRTLLVVLHRINTVRPPTASFLIDYSREMHMHKSLLNISLND